MVRYYDSLGSSTSTEQSLPSQRLAPKAYPSSPLLIITVLLFVLYSPPGEAFSSLVVMRRPTFNPQKQQYGTERRPLTPSKLDRTIDSTYYNKNICSRRQGLLWTTNDDSSDSSSHPDADGSSNNQTLITREIFQRELLQEPVVKRNNKKGSQYKILDNRDSLPFRVEHVTPDPYTHPEIKKKQRLKNKAPRRPGSIEEGLISSVYDVGQGNNNNNDVDTKTRVGEFILDKHTTTGDLLEIGDMQYKVVRHKCQYKYAGGKRFVMVRKILQVKEVGRVLEEEYLKRQWKKAPFVPSPSSPENL